jgi:2-C-methyl-D-erythritol 4-phosphate cytidylyltransferase
MRQRGFKTLAVGRQTDPQIDVSRSESILHFIECLEQKDAKFDHVIYCPGALLLKNIREYDEQEWDYTYDVNLKGVFRLLRHIPRFLNRGGHILVIGSSSYSLGRAGYSAYSSSKAALINLIQAAADEFPEYRLNVLSPQRAATDLRVAAFGNDERARTLLDPDAIAESALDIIATELTGMNFDVRVDVPFAGRGTK